MIKARSTIFMLKCVKIKRLLISLGEKMSLNSSDNSGSSCSESTIYTQMSSISDNSITNHLIENNLIKNFNNQNNVKKSPVKLLIKSQNGKINDNLIIDEDDDEDIKLLGLIEENTQFKRNKLFHEMQFNCTPPVIEPKKETFYELPMQVGDMFKKLRNIQKFYEWQDECLKLKCLNSSQYSNLLYLAPTSGGKTLIAEISILKCLLLRKKNCIFIMPFVSIVQEKVKLMKEFSEYFEFYCEEYANLKGRLPPIKRRNNKNTLYICTIEKANSLINSLIETNRLQNEIGLIVCDELHMIGDGPRGAIYEILLTKVKFLLRQLELNEKNKKSISINEKIQIVATTATLDNKKELANYLNAYLYEKNFRPVELKEYVKYDKQIYLINNKESNENKFKLDRTIDFSSYTNENMKSADPDFLVGLVLEMIPEKSCLIFCSTKRNCENVATLLSTHLPKELTQYKRDLKLQLYNELRAENMQQICPILRKTLPYGIAYHHSGLTSEERQLIEQAYKDGVLCIITCTSTLAAGVNLPAQRVIIRSPYVGQQFLTTHQYRQMIGRAGRAGFTDSIGESILIVDKKNFVDKTKIGELTTGPMTRCESSLNCNDSKAIRSLILSLVDLKLIKNLLQVCEFFEQTLYFMQKSEKNERIYIYDALTYLADMKLIVIKCKNEADKFISIKQLFEKIQENFEDFSYIGKYELEITKLGVASIKCGIDLDLIPKLYTDLTYGLKNMVLSTNLHLLYLCTPYDLVNSLINIDYDTYARKFCNLNEDEIKCANIIGVSEQYLQKKRFNKATNTKVDEDTLRRFYLTLIIYDLWKSNNSIWQVSNEFQLDRGFVQQIIQSAASFSNGVMHFCENLDEFWPYKNLLQEFTRRLQYNCVSSELIPLLELDNVKLARAKQLYDAGFQTLESIANANANDLVHKIMHLPLNAAKKIVKSANELLKEKAEVLQSEVNEILDQITDSTMSTA